MWDRLQVGSNIFSCTSSSGRDKLHSALLLRCEPHSYFSAILLVGCLVAILVAYPRILLTLFNWVHSSFTEAVAVVDIYLGTFNPIYTSL